MTETPARDTLKHPDATIYVDCRAGKRTITVEPNGGVFTPTKTWVTSYPNDLIEHVLRVKGPAYLCDEIMRDEDPRYVQHDFNWDILSYVGRQEFVGKRVLDFGAGSGASTLVLARMLPKTTFVGVELVPEFVELARHRAQFYGLDDRLSFHLSPDPNQLPSEIGEVDFIVFSAVYEHLLPKERQQVLPLLWLHLKRGGILFLDQTPYRWFPIELHTTGLPLLNYLPDQLAHWVTRKLSKRMGPNASWPDLLRKGIRGGTTRGILATLNAVGDAKLLTPSQLGVRDRIDLWYRLSSTTRKPILKKFMMWCFRGIRGLTGITMIPTLSLAIEKRK